MKTQGLSRLPDSSKKQHSSFSLHYVATLISLPPPDAPPLRGQRLQTPAFDVPAHGLEHVQATNSTTKANRRNVSVHLISRFFLSLEFSELTTPSCRPTQARQEHVFTQSIVFQAHGADECSRDWQRASTQQQSTQGQAISRHSNRLVFRRLHCWTFPRFLSGKCSEPRKCSTGQRPCTKVLRRQFKFKFNLHAHRFSNSESHDAQLQP